MGVEIKSANIIYGQSLKKQKVNLSAHKKEASEIWGVLQKINNGYMPQFRRIKNCQICEYNEKCKNLAIEKDDLSLLNGISTKEIERWNNKGIFTVNQLSYNFRPRRKRKQNINYKKRNIFELRALAIRENKIYVYELPKTIDATKVEIYWDIEGIPETKSFYLIGVLISENGELTKHQFWAGNKKEEKEIFLKFLQLIEKLGDYTIYCYGNYEIQYLKFMQANVVDSKYHSIIIELIDKSLNLLKYFSYNIYVPVYGNGLKEIGNYFGLKWTNEKITGINSIVVRKEWESTKCKQLKNDILQYNYEDCKNLYHVKQFIKLIIEKKHTSDFSFKVEYEDVYDKNTRFGILEKKFANTNFEFILNASYFDYQHDRVFVRDSKKRRNKRKLPNNPYPRKPIGRTNQVIEFKKSKCICCTNKDIGKISREKSKKVVDIKFNESGVKKWITKYVSYEYYCSNCNYSFVPKEYASIKEHYGHSLKSWVIYQHFVNTLSFGEINKNLELLFKIKLTKTSGHSFKKYFNDFYSETFKKLLSKIIASPVVYVDETPFKLLSGEVYGWIFTNGQEVVSLFKTTRKGDFLKELLKDFNGVLVTDFYVAYNSLKCKQQKCLIHLIRDFNDDLLKNPFDIELKQITQKFTILLKTIVKAIEKFGLCSNKLSIYKTDVAQYFDFIRNSNFKSKIAQQYQERIIKNESMLFTFIEFDNVSWNNTFAEHAIKLLAVHRNKNVKFFKESRMEEYLMIMSLYQTCAYKNINFLHFLLSKETDIDNFCGQK